MKIDHDYSIEGWVSGRIVLGEGKGTINRTLGVSEMEVKFSKLPATWDPRSIVLMCCNRALVMASREEGAISMYTASKGCVTIGRDISQSNRIGVIHDGNGQLYANVQASSNTDLRGEVKIDSSRIESGFCNLTPGVNGINHVKPFSGTMLQSGPKIVTLVTSYEVETEDNKILFGYTFYPHYLPEQELMLDSIQELKIEKIEQELNGNVLWLRTTSVVRPMSEVLISASVPGIPKTILANMDSSTNFV